MRDGISGMYDSVSREIRTRGRRDSDPRRDVDRSAGVGRGATDWDAPYDADREVASPRDSSRGLAAKQAGKSLSNSHPQPSLAMRLRNRRKKVRTASGGGTGANIGTIVLVVLLAIVIGGAGFLSGYGYNLVQQNQVQIALLTINTDNQTTKIYDRNGVLLFKAFGANSGRHDYITYCQIPEIVKYATVDTEDNSFWTNPGVDVYHEVGAVVKDLSAGGAVLGASTITQQLVKTAVLNNSNKNLTRKLDENILAINITQRYTKQQILTMYLNEAPYGPLDYGIEAAAENYFGYKVYTLDITQDPQAQYPNIKDPTFYTKATKFITHMKKEAGCLKDGQTTVQMSGAWQLEPWQATLLAGVPQDPNVHAPYNHPQNAVTRQKEGVLDNIVSNGHLDQLLIDGKQATVRQMVDLTWSQICLQDPNNKDIEHLQKCPNVDSSGKDNGKRAIYNSAFQSSSGANTTLAPFFVDYVKKALEKQLGLQDGNFDPIATKGWNIYTTLDYGDPSITDDQLSHIMINANGDLGVDDKTINSDFLSHVGLQQYADYVTRRNITGVYPDYWYCGAPWSSTRVYTKQFPAGFVNPFAKAGHGQCYEQALNVPLNKGGKNANDGATVAIDPRNGEILAMVGGVNYNATDATSKLDGGENNVTDLARSMGSSTKPLVYATAFQMGWNPGTIVRDQPTCWPTAANLASEVTDTDRYICPGHYLAHNYTRTDWAGAAPLTYELGNSLNTPAELALSFTGLHNDNSSPILSMAQRLGVTSLTAGNLGPTTALGAQDIKLTELTSAYGTFANGGLRYPAHSIITVKSASFGPVYDINKTQLFPEKLPTPIQALSPQAAYEVTSILTNNDARGSDFGPDNPLYFPGRETAGKTGTSEDVKDIVTVGYTPSLSIGVWVGNADDSKLSGTIIGIAGAAYIYNAVMAFAIDHYKMPGTKPSSAITPTAGGSFPIPPGMHRAILSCHTGLQPYAGETGCDPTSYAVPDAMKGDLTIGKDGKATWNCYAWGCYDSYNQIGDKTGQAQDIAWMPDGQDPVSP